VLTRERVRCIASYIRHAVSESHMKQQDAVEARRVVQAIAWRVRLTEIDAGNGEEVEDFQAWLAEDESNADAWQEVDGPWRLLGDHATAPEIISARRAALARAQQTGWKHWRGTSMRAGRTVYATAAGLLVTVALAFFVWQSSRPLQYSTGASERRIVTLTDGSIVSLDAYSEVRVRYSSAVRDLYLLRGQATFDVAHDSKRPFTVVVGGRKVVATGTSFNIDLLESKLLVTLMQGRVVVIPDTKLSKVDARGGERFELTPGKQLIIDDQVPPSVGDVNVDLVTAWQTGMISFENEPLASAATRLNRYSDTALIIGDDAVGSLKVSGVFKASDMNGFVATITSYFPLSAHAQPGGDVELTLQPNRRNRP
jgi:transmembrane sensor